MSKTKQVGCILLSFAAIIFLPLIGSYIHHQYQFPEHYFRYPMLKAQEKAGFSWLIFGMVATGGIGVVALYLFPQLFGFKKTITPPTLKIAKVKWPWWLWLGIVSLGTCLLLLWSKSHGPVLFLH
ncbi:MAG: hypothetical protein EOO88_60530, partial [Pedobacter sp.]